MLAYVSNGYTVELIHFKEILIASIGLLAVPKNLRIDIEEFIGNSKLLGTPNGALSKSKKVADDLNNISEAIDEIATTYVERESTSTKTKNSENNKNKQIFITELLHNLNPYGQNMLYEDMANTDGEIVDQIFNTLLDKQKIDEEDLVNIFANCNSYLLDFEDNDMSLYLQKDISQIVREINNAYKISKLNFIWQKKVDENKKNVGKQLSGVSKAIRNMAKGLEKETKTEEQYEMQKAQILELIEQRDIQIEDIIINKNSRFFIEIYLKDSIKSSKIQEIEKVLTKVFKEKIVYNNEASVGNRLNFLSDDKYVMALGKSEVTKSKSEVSGDSNLAIRLKDGKYLIAISDGMGSGINAKNSSEKALRLLENLLVSGFDKKTSLDLINSSLINQEKEIFCSLDIAIVDLYEGNIEFLKNGACPTYIKNQKKVQIIKSNSLPAGIIEEAKIQTFDKDIKEQDIVLMCTDGILDSNVEYKNKELWIKYLLEDIETTNTQKIADLILNEAIDNNYGTAKDDMSIMVFKFIKK